MYRIIAFVILLVFSISWPVFAESTSKVGVVDGEKLFDLYPGAQEATKKISNAQDDLKDAISESERIYEEFEKQKKSEAEKLTKKKELQLKIDTKAQETKKMIETLSAKIENDIVQAIKKISSQKGLDVVLDKRAVLVGGADITDEVSDYLKKGPIAEEPIDENIKLQESKKDVVKKTN